MPQPIRYRFRYVHSFGLLLVTDLFLLPLQLAKDLLHPTQAEERRKHKLKRLVQHPNSYFMDIKCPGMSILMTMSPVSRFDLFCPFLQAA